MPNIGKHISSHNKKILQPPPELPRCTCRKYACPVNGECEKTGVIYQCTVTERVSGKSENYVGLTEKSFKDRITKHRSSFRNRNYQKNTLSKHIWGLKDQNLEFDISWKILDQAKPYSPATKVCNLCLRESYFIIYHKKKATLNKRKEFFGYCLHKSKYYLENN